MGLALVAATIVVATAVGVAAERRYGAPSERVARRMLWTMLYVLVPPLVFFNVAHLKIDANVGGGVALGWLALVVVAGLAWWLAPDRAGRPAQGTVMVGALLANTGYLGYPLTTVLFGADSLPQAVSYDLLVAAPALFLGGFGIGASFGRLGGESLGRRVRAFFLRNPLMPAFILGIMAPSSLAPEQLVTASRVAVFAMLPMGFFAVGVHLASSLPGRAALPRPSREVGVAVALRLVVAPVLLWLLALPLIDLPAPYLLLAAMPCGINALVVANVYGLERRLAAAMIAWSTALVLAGVIVVMVARA